MKVGDKVTSPYFPQEGNVARTIIAVEHGKQCASGYRVSADGGDPCFICGHVAHAIYGVDASWFQPYKTAGADKAAKVGKILAELRRMRDEDPAGDLRFNFNVACHSLDIVENWLLTRAVSGD